MLCPKCNSEMVIQYQASTTQLLNGTMLTYLTLTKPYYIDPDSKAFMLQGTKHHQELELIAKELGLASEIPLSVDRDIFDLLEIEDGKIVLTDYKLWGSFRIAKVLGIEEAGRQPDPSGELYKSSGKWGKAGTPKMIPKFQENPEKSDNYETEFQLNRYRVMLAELGIRIDRMQLQVTVRDGGLYIAKNRGITRNFYKVPVRVIPDQDVLDFFNYKAECLKEALDAGWDEPCNDRETWEGIRCQSYCDVWEHCSKGQIAHSQKGDE